MRLSVPSSPWIVAAAGIASCLSFARGPSSASAQTFRPSDLQVEVGVQPDTVTAGEPFRSVIRVVLPDGFRIEFPDLPPGDSVEASKAPQVADRGGAGMHAVYEMVSWFTGDELTASLTVRLISPGGEVTQRTLPLAMPVVASVLPAGEEDVVPRPLKGLVVPTAASDRFPWWWLLLAALIATAGFYAWYRSRRTVKGEGVLDPQAWALSELDALLEDESSTLDPVERYRRGSWVLREYLARVDAQLGAELTTGEILRRSRPRGMEETVATSLKFVLESADRVKFSAGHPATAAGARETLLTTRDLVERYPAPVEAAVGRRRAA